MEDFELHIPTKIIFGKNKVSEIGKHAKEFGKKILLVYGMGSIKKNKVYSQVIKSLQKENLEIVEHAGVKSNPVLSHVKQGISISREENIDLILAVGGGSVIDASKSIAAGTLYDGDVWDFYEDKAEIKKALPVLTVLTIPAAGSEMNGGTVVTNEKTKEKYGFLNEHLCPRLSILDPTVTYSISKDYTAYSGVDACLHLLEGYFTHTADWYPIQDRYVEGLVRSIMESTDMALKKPEDYTARATLMWAASLAWNGIGNAGLKGAEVQCHMFAHVLGAYYDIAHGAALSIITPGWMEFNLDKKTKIFAQLARKVFDTGLEDEREAALEGINNLKKWFSDIGSPVSFTDMGLPKNELDSLTDSTMKLADLWDIKGYTRKDILEIFKLCL
jgi:alcohol dehydrogenase YqhD (iron-dependent ADH family)